MLFLGTSCKQPELNWIDHLLFTVLCNSASPSPAAAADLLCFTDAEEEYRCREEIGRAHV